MKWILTKILVCMALTGGIARLCRILEIRPLLPGLLMAWGAICFLFSRELSGAQVRFRDGFKEKPVLQILWMIAGVLCALISIGTIYFWAF